MRVSRIFAAFAAAVLLLFCSDRIPADIFPSVHAKEVSDSMELPEWVPQSYGDALRFFNLHGGTYIQDGLLCVTFCRIRTVYDNYPQEDYTVAYLPKVMKQVSHELYNYPSEKASGKLLDLEVCVYQPVSSGRFEVFLHSLSLDGMKDFYGKPYDPSYEFFVDEDLNITETDLYAQLPDCVTEYEEFYEEHGQVSVIGDNLVFCLKNSSHLFSQWKEGYCSENMCVAGIWSCSERKPAYSGFSVQNPVQISDIIVYRAVSDGPVYVRWDVVDEYHPDAVPYYGIAAAYQDASLKTPALSKGDARIKITDYETGDPVIIDDNTGFSIHRKTSVTNDSTLIAPVSSNPCVIPGLCKPSGGFQADPEDNETIPLIADALSFKLVAPDSYSIPKKGNSSVNADDHLTITLVNGEAYDLEYRVRAELSGDVNGDGEFDTADLVTLQKWLLGKSDTVLKNWKAADFCNDNVIDSFDLCHMRKALIDKNTEPPVTLFVLDKSRTYNTEKGVKESRTITTLEDKDFAETDGEILSLAQKISDNIDKYENTELKRLNFSIADYGEDVLYLVYRKPDQDPGRMVICTYGESCSWLDDKDVQELVILLIENGYFADEYDALSFKEAQ